MDQNANISFDFGLSDNQTGTAPLTNSVSHAAPPRPLSPSAVASTQALPSAIADAWGALSHAGISAEMYSRLIRLASAPRGWRGSGSEPLSPASLNQFLQFWSLVHDDAAEPELALAPDGSLAAEWFKSPRQRLDIRFSENKARFGLFTNTNILEGADNFSTVAAILKNHHSKPLKWSAA